MKRGLKLCHMLKAESENFLQESVVKPSKWHVWCGGGVARVTTSFHLLFILMSLYKILFQSKPSDSLNNAGGAERKTWSCCTRLAQRAYLIQIIQYQKKDYIFAYHSVVYLKREHNPFLQIQDAKENRSVLNANS